VSSKQGYKGKLVVTSQASGTAIVARHASAAVASYSVWYFL